MGLTFIKVLLGSFPKRHNPPKCLIHAIKSFLKVDLFLYM